MALEDTLLETNNLLKQVITILQTGVSAGAELGSSDAAGDAAKGKGGRPKKDAPATSGKPVVIDKPFEGDADGTRYFVVEKHNTVFKVKPGDDVPTVDGAVECAPAAYLVNKAAFEKKSVVGQAGTQSTAAASPASSPAASTASSSTPTGFPAVVDKLKEVAMADGLGRPALDKILAEYGVKSVKDLQPLSKDAEILAKATALLNPAAAVTAEFDPFA